MLEVLLLTMPWKVFEILQLPSKATLQAYTGAFIHKPGARIECIESQVAYYVLFKQQYRDSIKQGPTSDGVLIFDEVKETCQLMWNSHSHQSMGLAMTHKGLLSLIEYCLKDPETAQQIPYIPQFLWHDLTSKLDIVQPYSTNQSTMENKIIMSCIMGTIKMFQFHGIKTSLLFCDGTSPNVSVIKKPMGTVEPTQ